MKKMKTIGELIDRLTKNPRIVGLVEYGSACAGDPEIHGDYDLIAVLVSRDPAVESVHFRIGDVPVDLNLRTLEEIGRLDRAAGFDEVLLEGRIVHYPTGNVATALEALRKRHAAVLAPPPPPGEIAVMRHGSRHTFDKMRHRLDAAPTLSALLLHQNVYWLVRNWFPLRNAEFPGEKRALAEIEERDTELYDWIRRFYETTDRRRMVDLSRRIAERVLQPVGGMWADGEILAFGPGTGTDLAKGGERIYADLFGSEV